MKTFLFGSVALIAINLSVASQAADIPTKALPAPIAAPPYNWSGFYVGANLGGAWTSDNLNIPNNSFYGGLTEFIGRVESGPSNR